MENLWSPRWRRGVRVGRLGGEMVFTDACTEVRRFRILARHPLRSRLRGDALRLPVPPAQRLLEVDLDAGDVAQQFRAHQPLALGAARSSWRMLTLVISVDIANRYGRVNSARSITVRRNPSL